MVGEYTTKSWMIVRSAAGMYAVDANKEPATIWEKVFVCATIKSDAEGLLSINA